MRDPAILYPVFALALWTALVLLLIPIARIGSAFRGEIHSAIHLTYNKVLRRLAAFALSNVVLIALWANAGMRLLSPATR